MKNKNMKALSATLKNCYCRIAGCSCRIEECSFGNFVTDAMASEMGVDIAFINSGAIKGSFDPTKRNGKKKTQLIFNNCKTILFLTNLKVCNDL